MKKKAIKKIPYLTLPAVHKGKKVKYIGVTAIKMVGKEKHLFLEIYLNSNATKDVPLVRIVLAKSDFGNYFPEKDEWTRQKIEVDRCYNRGLIWHSHEECKDTYPQMEGKNVLQSNEDLERMKTFCDSYDIYNQKRWWEYVYNHQDHIVYTKRKKARERKYERRQQALNDRIAHTPELPEQMILERVDNLYFYNKHYLYYKKHGCFADIACSKCGGVTEARWKDGISYESRFQKRYTEEPRKGHHGTCPLCGARGVYKCQGKVKGSYSQTTHIFLGQKYKGTGMVMRYIEVAKKWNLEFIAGNKGLEMHGAYEELSGIEIARGYFEPGKKLQIDYHKCGFDGKNFWDDCNLYGNANITVNAAPILYETYREMEGTIFKYSALQEYVKQAGEVNPIDYFNRYLQIPQIEMLVKLGLTGVVEQLLKCYCGIVVCQDAKSPDIFLGIRKDRVKQLIANKGDTSLLKVMQMEKRMQQMWTDEQIEHLAETNLERGSIETATRYMSLQQLLNRIEKYSGCEYGSGCSTAIGRIRRTATTYTDYLSMRISLGYDLTNTVYQYPRSLDAAHAKMVAETNQKAVDNRLTEVEEKFAEIRHNYRKLRNKYYYEDDNYIIRPARSAREIVIEGRSLHHCVGGDNYLNKHSKGVTYILMLRLKNAPEVPYITVEIDSTRPKIIQWYGEHDKKPHELEMQKWLNDYLSKLKNDSKPISTVA